jgi:hypothetical protein
MPDLEHLHKELIIRTARRRRAAVITAAVAMLLLLPLLRELLADDEPELSRQDGLVRQTFFTKLLPMRDTLYTTSPSYLQIRIDSQVLQRHWADGRIEQYRISSGNASLTKGKETPCGVYLLQSKAELQISKQFDDAKMYFWMQFSGNYGIHALAGRGYYGHLGRRASSHGCVRISREDAQLLYSSVPLGTPVAISNGEPARVVAFFPAGARPDTARRDLPIVLDVYRRQLADLYDGNRLSMIYPMIPLYRKFVKHEGLPIGEASRIPAQQVLPSYYAFTSARPVDGTGTETLKP